MKKHEVCGHYILVKPDKIETKSKGGIVLAEDFDVNKAARVESASTTGVVLAIGSMAWKAYDGGDPNWKPWCKVGDRIVHTKFVAKEYKDRDNLDENGNPETLFIIADENCLMVLPKSDETSLEEVA